MTSGETLLVKADFNDQVYSNTRVPTQLNTSQHDSDTNEHESTRINTSPTRMNTSQQESDTNQHESTQARNK